MAARYQIIRFHWYSDFLATDSNSAFLQGLFSLAGRHSRVRDTPDMQYETGNMHAAT